MAIKHHHCIGLRFFSPDVIQSILDLAKQIKHNDVSIDLSNKIVVQLFFEPSTRTRLSFEIATQKCKATPMMIDIETSSLTKGESLLDMVKNIASMNTDALIVRHSSGGVPYFISEHVGIPVINAGDGYHEHPSQGLLDIFTMQENLGDLTGKHVLILGDIMHSRVAKSNIWGLQKCGAKVSVAGPSNLVPEVVKLFDVDICDDIDALLPKVDAVNVLRIQFERQHGIEVPSVDEYRHTFGMTKARQQLLPDHAIVLHPGPINRGVELDSDVADGDRNVILDQVENGVYIRMALLSKLMEGGL
jgi:aspartate carbamoyltransferase catalytic subunit